jgi:hypothetical protein
MYNKIFTKILDSSIWLAPDPHRLIWITLLAAMDEDSNAMFACAANLAARARVSIEYTESALRAFSEPDLNSGDPEYEGRRIERIPGGWHILNGPKYREIVTRSVAREKTRERVQRFREGKRNGVVTLGNAHVTPSNVLLQNVTPSETVSETETKSETDQRMEKNPLPLNAPQQNVSEAQIAQHMHAIRTTYPPPNGRCDWITGEKAARQIVLNDGVQWPDLIAGTQRYRAFIAATGSYVMNPSKFFSAVDRPWSQPWDLPVPIERKSTPVRRRKTADELEAEEASKYASR